MTAALLEKDQPGVLPPGEDEVTRYLQEIRQYPRLTAPQERELARRCAQGDEDALRQMVSSNLRLVFSVAREYAGRGVPLLDLIQEGSIGLVAAARKFDYALEYRFSTYATKWIRQGISRCVMNHAGLIRVPEHTAQRMRRVLGAKASLEQELQETPTAEQIGARCGLPAEKVTQLLNLVPQVCSLDAPAGEEEGTLALVLEDLHAPQPQEELVRRELKAILDLLLSRLTQRQQQVLRLRFGMEDGTCHSLEEIGKALGISKERARQIEHQAVEKLHKLGADLGLEDYL